jgi:hypothetical protein
VQEDGSPALDKPLRGKKSPSGGGNAPANANAKGAKIKDRGARGNFHAGPKSGSPGLKTSAKKTTAKVPKKSKNRQ